MAHGWADDTVHQVVRYKFMRDIDPLRGIHGIIAHNVLDLHTLNSPFGIPFIHGNLGRVENFHARCGGVPGKRAGIADVDAFFNISAVSETRKTNPIQVKALIKLGVSPQSKIQMH
jgi:hypothetical protein